MKRIIYFILSVVMIASLTACGNSIPGETTKSLETTSVSLTLPAPQTETLYTEETFEIPSGNVLTENFKYTLSSDYVSEVNMYANSARSKVISSGALAYLDRKELFGTESKTGETSGYCYCIFNESTMTLNPICSDTTCKHSDYNCIARDLALVRGINYCTVVSDRIIKTDYDTETIFLTYYDLGGNIQHVAEFSVSDLLLPNGSPAEKYIISVASTCRYENRVFFDVTNYTSSDVAEAFDELGYYVPGGIFYHWILCLDLAAGDIYPVGGFRVTRPDSLFVTFLEAAEGEISFRYGKNDYYRCNTKNGVTEKFDTAAIINALKITGKTENNSILSEFLPVKGIISLTNDLSSGENSSKKYFDINTLEEIIPTETEMIEINNHGGLKSEFMYNGEKFCMIKESNGKDYRLLGSGTEITGTTEITKNREGDEGKYNLHDAFETEKGFVYYLIKRGTPDTVTKTENGIQVNYFKPHEMVYISKADLIDGGEVTPLYYNAETGVFAE